MSISASCAAITWATREYMEFVRNSNSKPSGTFDLAISSRAFSRSYSYVGKPSSAACTSSSSPSDASTVGGIKVVSGSPAPPCLAATMSSRLIAWATARRTCTSSKGAVCVGMPISAMAQVDAVVVTSPPAAASKFFGCATTWATSISSARRASAMAFSSAKDLTEMRLIGGSPPQ